MGPRVLDHYVQREMNKTNWWIAHVPFENFMHMMHAQCQTKTKITITTKHNTLTELPSPQFIVHHSWSIAIRYPRKTTKNHPSPFPSSSISQWQVFALWDLSISMHLNAGKKRNPKWYVRASQRNDDFFRLKQKRIATCKKNKRIQRTEQYISNHYSWLWARQKEKNKTKKKIRFPNDFVHGCIAKTSRLKRTRMFKSQYFSICNLVWRKILRTLMVVSDLESGNLF